MGIQGLSKLLYEKAPHAIKERDIKSFFGRRIAIDASMSIYQCIIAMKGFQDGQGVELTNQAGEVTSHLNGIFSRTLRMVDEGIKPIYVFDGEPPKLKNITLDSRRQKADEASKKFDEAKEAGDDEIMEKMSKRTVRVTSQQNEDVKKMLQLMGIPVVQAASEAEAQCAELVLKGKAWAVGTEDMDALTFGSKVMLRHLHFSDAKKRPIVEIHLDEVLRESELSTDQFIDLCILLGCDYLPKIPGIGPQKAWENITRFGSIEKILESLDPVKHQVPENFIYKEARELFKNPKVFPADSLPINFSPPNEQGLTDFLVRDKLFNPERIKKAIERLNAAFKVKTQARLEDFFAVSKPALQLDSKKSAGKKRERVDTPGAFGTLKKSGTSFKKAVKK